MRSSLRSFFSFTVRPYATLVLSGTVAVMVMGSAACNLQLRDEEIQKADTGTQNVDGLIAEARALEGGLTEPMERARATSDRIAQLANDFAKVSEEIEVRRLLPKQMTAVLSFCWKRDVDDAPCSPPARALKAANKVRRSANDATKNFVADKMAQIDLLRPALSDELPGAADELATEVEDMQNRLADIQARFDAEVNAEGVAPETFDPQIKEMQEIHGRVESQVGQAQNLVSEIKDTVEPLRVSVRETLDNFFFLKGR